YGVTNIGNTAFLRSGLSTVSLPDSMRSIGDSAFSDCTVLTHVAIPESVLRIGDWAFSSTGLKTLTIPSSVTHVGDAAFRNCFALTNVTLVRGISRIAGAAFRDCPRLNNVTIPDSVIRIEDWAFYGCTSLSQVCIPESVTHIGGWAFADCNALRAVYFMGNAPADSQRRVFGDGLLNRTPSKASIHYLPGTRGWGSTFSDRPAAPWVRLNPTILDFGDRFGPSTNGLGFVVSWATNLPVIMEASTALDDSDWTPISTNTPTEGWFLFMDPGWNRHPARFYRARSGGSFMSRSTH
ncbi:MAG: leucine-rich repeat domain-containing protein, partial [Nitrospira sp.]|nr:leucine-rich repeat domain-containing protein [Nitrospira sp.]